MTFYEKYTKETTWHGKALVMALFHRIMTQKEKGWTITKTAESFGVSIGLVSENLGLADLIDVHPTIVTRCKSRQEALDLKKRV